ncbi:DUF6519 domain-containing protein [Methylomonas sp. MgM2]
MKGDFSRDTFDITKHFSRVLQQQGRVQLDADWNEQTAILLHYLRTLAADLIGPFGGPQENYGFEITISEFSSEKKWDFSIGKGRYYVDGILCENESEALTYLTQPDYPNPNPKQLEDLKMDNCLVYLDVWEHHVSALEDDAIREKALGGPDTAARAKVVCQVKVEFISSEIARGIFSNNKLNILNWLNKTKEWQPEHRGSLKVRLNPSQKSEDPCVTAPDAKYRGAENQLYRVEIHQMGIAGKATFKWSRDNGSVVSSCSLNGNELTLENPQGFSAPGWVELTNDKLELRGQPGTLVKVVKVDGDVLCLDSNPARPDGVTNSEEVWPTKVRRWESKDISITESDEANDVWFKLEHGIEIQFLNTNDEEEHQYRTGDYWLIPARLATGIEWLIDENEQPLPQPPDGVLHHYAPLTMLTKDVNGKWQPTDLRSKFKHVS